MRRQRQADLQAYIAKKKEQLGNQRVQEQHDRYRDWDQIVATCYEVIRDCPDPLVRRAAARLLHTMCSRDDLNVVKVEEQ